MKSLAVFMAATISATFWVFMAFTADCKDAGNARPQQIALQSATATAQIAEAIEEFIAEEMGHVVSVGLLSTGVDESVPELKGQLLTGANFAVDEPDIIDRNGVGTYTAALIVGIAPNVRVLPIKVLNKIGQGPTSQIVKGIDFGVERGADILLIPGGAATGGDPGLQEAVARARQRGILLIAPAGNSRSSRRHYPGAFKEVLAVGTTDAWGRKQASSNYGDWVGLFAPWVDLRSIYSRSRLRGLSVSNPGAAIVAGVAALVLGINPDLGADGAEEILLTTATDISSRNPGMGVGARRVNALAAVRAAKVSAWLGVRSKASGYE
ncbi:MAG: S8 family serine peptidase [Desulfobacterales bacterium]|nr:S8 family serine peptidase [Desulfobacterales bacterium]